MTFEQYQTEWNALKRAVIECVTPTHHAIECLIALKYTAKEAETEIENWLFEASMQNQVNVVFRGRECDSDGALV